ncbi:sulfurtransferase complex subunit TusB [Vibrio sp. YMD68]|uniref:sulfurtransferase complex subunit TusB n=1 Tax=Vibrio sp. YMD68 TaxID=3042300 RepID=UPI00249C56F3|nr:sulfurtransferase complex subunit TusB [Vibrio sp. YMD68]WGW00030.1 sulfurtransferase complex subunit TusB [Vibrio sp. YMD68]
MLYIVTTPEKATLAIQFATQTDAVLLTQSAVYLTNPKHAQHHVLNTSLCQVLALNIDLKARGIEQFVAQGVSSIDIDEFVDLTAKHLKSVSW